ncbi:MAG TPA: adenylate/guanylate cyclase domain-containing protein [Candidatus Tectomicrobia bacterium]|nr:adenylate/guanylate cyclase domain-containing protein [Candidatus Tectomicrobia bacterium]
MRFRSFRGRLVVVFLGLFAIIQAVSFVVVMLFVRAAAREEIDEELRIASTLFVRQLEGRSQQLVAATRLLAGDFALKSAVATADHATTRSVLENHRLRIGADVLMLVSLDGAVVVGTRDAEGRPLSPELRALLEAAEDAGEASRIMALEPGLFRLAMVPVLAPVPIAWLCAGFAIDDETAGEMRRLTGLHVSFVTRGVQGPAIRGSTLPPEARDALRHSIGSIGRQGMATMAGAEHVLRLTRVADDVDVVIQRPLAAALAARDRLLRVLLAVGAAGLGLALVGAIVVARRVTRPVSTLAGAARRVAAGDFSASVPVQQRDELGELATTFNDMVAGLRERDRVRTELERANRLKRFFSPQLAEVLSAGEEAALRSHRREVTVVFCDLRGFTAFADAADPEDVMRLLREYHAAVGPLVFEAEGTLERFTGDGLMVFFNDPVPCPDHAARAVRMAVAMRDAVQPLLEGWRRRGYGLGFGAGIARGHATVGPIGFEGRFDYAAIGGVTNLAARLCQEADDGQILIAQSVHAEVEGLVESVLLGEVVLKGFAKPIKAYNVVRLRAAAGVPDSAAARVSPSP